ncbi:MAG: hypothetical protein H7A25_20050 [Leptospiraceae bacterium]|nr:hypothetical protein [Leptospiraceae bacterium]
MTPELLLEKVANLPAFAQQELFDFVDFLSIRYLKKKESNISVTSEGERFIDKRLELLEKNQENLISWDSLKEKLKDKYDWKI